MHVNVNIHMFVIWWSLQSTSDIILLGVRVSSWVRPTQGVELKIASLIIQGNRLQHLHVPKTVELCLKIGPGLYWIELVVMSSLMTPNSNSNLNLKSIQNKKKPSSTILSTHKSSFQFTLAHQTCKLDQALQNNVDFGRVYIRCFGDWSSSSSSSSSSYQTCKLIKPYKTM